MKKSSLIIHVIHFMILVFVGNIFAQWTEIGPGGGWITCMKSFPTAPHKMFCGVLNGGAFVSENRGQNWSLIPEIGEQTPVYDISLLADGTVYIAGESGLFSSQNFGVSWKRILKAPTWQVFAINESTVAADTSEAKDSYPFDAHPSNTPWIISFDNGQNWQFWQGTVDSSLYTTYRLMPYEKRGNFVLTADNQIFRTEGLKVFKTMNDNWTEWQCVSEIDTGWSNYCQGCLFSPDSGITFYAFAESYDFHPGGHFQGGVFKSIDSCASWTKIPITSSATALNTNGGNVFVGASKNRQSNTNSQLFRYDTEDQSSTQLTQFGGDITAIDAARWDMGDLLVATESGIFKTKDYGETWFPTSTGISHSNAMAVQLVQTLDNKERIVLAVYKGGIWASEDDGNSWECKDQLSYVLPGLLKKAPNHPQYLYAGGARFYKSSDYGDSWDDFSDYYFPASYYDRYGRAVDITVDPSDPHHVIAHYDDHSMDNYRGIVCAETFDQVNIWVPHIWFEDSHNKSFSALLDSNRLWIAKVSSGYLSTATPAFMVIDSTWENNSRSIYLPDSAAASYWCVNKDTCYAINIKRATFYRSDDLGETWFSFQFDEFKYNRFWQDWGTLDHFGQLAVSPNGRYLFFVYPGSGVFVSDDKGETWNSVNNGLNTLNTYQVAFSSINPNIAYLATENGLFKIDCKTGIAGDDDRKYLSETRANPNDFLVCNNYPNPFNPETTIKFQTVKSGKIEVSVYNILGVEVDKLVDNQFIEAGGHFIKWDASGCPSGLYLIRLKVGNNYKVKKVLLLK